VCPRLARTPHPLTAAVCAKEVWAAHVTTAGSAVLDGVIRRAGRRALLGRSSAGLSAHDCSQGRAWKPRRPWRAGRAAPVGGEHDRAPGPVPPDDLPGEPAGRAPPAHGGRQREPPEGHHRTHAGGTKLLHAQRACGRVFSEARGTRDCPALREGPAPPRVGVHAGGGLIQEHDARLAQERERHAQLAPLAARQLARARALLLAQACRARGGRGSAAPPPRSTACLAAMLPSRKFLDRRYPAPRPEMRPRRRGSRQRTSRPRARRPRQTRGQRGTAPRPPRKPRRRRGSSARRGRPRAGRPTTGRGQRGTAPWRLTKPPPRRSSSSPTSRPRGGKAKADARATRDSAAQEG